MMSEDYSCIKEVTKVVNLTLPSMYNTNEISGICDTLERWKRQYIKQLHGIVVGYKNVSLTSKRGYIRLDSPVIYCNVKATFELFYPSIGCIIKGKINRISQDYIGCLVHDTINVTVHQPTDVSSDISRFIVLDNFILFQITRINFKSKFIHVKGKITEECITIMKESSLFSNNIIMYDNDPVTNEIDTSTDNSSQTSSRKKKKKHKKSKDLLMSPSLISESLQNSLDQVELTQSSAEKRKHRKSDIDLNSSVDTSYEKVKSKKKIKTEKFVTNSENQLELDQSSGGSRKRKRKKSDLNLSSSADLSENEELETHPKKKMRTEEQIIWTNDTMETPPDTSKSKDINDISSISISPKKACKIENSTVKIELPLPVKKKKKSKNSLEASSFPDHILKNEINESDSSSLPHANPQNISTNSHINSEQHSLTSPDLFDESLSEEKNEELTKPKKKKKEKEKKNKDKSKKGSKKDKKKKKVISTKKKKGYNTKLKKTKNKDKKTKRSKKIKIKSEESKIVPE